MIKNIISIFAFTAFSIFAQSSKPLGTVQPEEFDFGMIKQGEVVSHNFKISNTSSDTLKILDVRASCGCTAATPSKNILAPGESTLLKVEFNSSGKTGKQQKYVYVKTNDPNKKIYKVKFVGDVAADEVLKPKTADGPEIFFPEVDHDFGTVQEGKVAKYTFKITNRGNKNLEITNIKTSCGCTAAMVDNKIIEPGKEGNLRVELDTKNRTGKMIRTISIASNDTTQSVRVLKITADVEGAK